MDKVKFAQALQKEVSSFNDAVATDDGDWIIKGFIDVAKNIYALSIDTKVISKILELLLIPRLTDFARKYQLKMVLVEYQNHYPDVSFIDEEGNRFAVDLKSTYRKNKNRVNGMTLGAFTGYFRLDESSKNITFPYDSYCAHFVLGIIYSKSETVIDEQKKFTIADLEHIPSVIHDFQFFVQEKYRIASDRPGSGNTKNIGSVTRIETLVYGKGPFANLGEPIFRDYWRFYLTADMARAAELPEPPYHNLETYLSYRGLR